MIRCARCWMTRSKMEALRIKVQKPDGVCCVTPYLSTDVA